MTTFQKIIKYLAIAFAIFIIFSICFAILKGINIFVNVLGNNKLSSELETVYIGECKKNMNIDLSYTNLIIKNGDSFKIETNNKNINVEYDKNRGFFNTRDENNYEFKTLSDAAGSGSNPLELSLPIPRFEELGTDNKSVCITLYRNDTIAREVDQTPNVQISVSEEAILKSSAGVTEATSINLLNNSYVTVEITRKTGSIATTADLKSTSGRLFRFRSTERL